MMDEQVIRTPNIRKLIKELCGGSLIEKATVLILIYPVAIEEGMRFAIREGGRTIGAGVVSKIVE